MAESIDDNKSTCIFEVVKGATRLRLLVALPILLKPVPVKQSSFNLLDRSQGFVTRRKILGRLSYVVIDYQSQGRIS